MATAPTSPRARWALATLLTGYALLVLLSATPDSALVPPLPEGAGPASWLQAVARRLGLDGLSRTGSTVACLLVLAAVAGAFLVVAVEAWRGAVSIRAVVVTGAASVAVILLGPVLLSRDVYSYAEYGRIAALHHANPYLVPPSSFPGDPLFPVISAAWRGTRSVYGPVFTLLSGGIARIRPDSVGASIQAFRAIAGLAAAGAGVLAAGAARRWGRPDRSAAAVAFVLLNPVMVVHTVGGGHNDALVALGVAGAAWLAVPNRKVASEAAAPRSSIVVGVTVVLTLAALVKVVAAIPLVLWLWRLWRETPRSRRVSVTAAHAGVVVAVTAAATAPFFAGRRTFGALANLASRQGWASGPRLVARGAQGLGRAVGGHATGEAFGVAVYAAFLLAFGAGLVLLMRSGDLEPGVWASGLLLFALSAPYLLPWYAAWFLPVLALTAGEGLVVVGLAVSMVLALTGVPAEPSTAPGLWRGMLLAVHYVAAPIMLAAFVAAMHAILRSTRGHSRPAP